MKQINKKILIPVICLLSLLIILLVAGASTAWFGTRREITGEAELSPGIKVDFKDTLDKANDNEFWLKKYDETNAANISASTTKSRLNISDVRLDNEFYLVNPTLVSNTTDSFYLRAKLVYQDKNGNDISSDKLLELFGTENPISLNNKWLKDETSGWSYYVDDSLTSWSDILSKKDQLKTVLENDEIDFFATETNGEINYTTLKFDGVENEYPPVGELYIVLEVQAVEIGKVSEGFGLN